jgi:hypothetical protein
MPMPVSTPDLRLAALTRFAIAITALNVVGHLWLGFEQALAAPFVGLASAYATELLLEALDAWGAGRPRRYQFRAHSLARFLLPAHITGLATAMLLYSNERLAPLAFAAAVAIASKYLFRVRMGAQSRHFFNPSNFGISVTLLAFPWIGIAMPYMFTENLRGWGNWALPALMIVTGTLLNVRLTRRLPLVAAWLGAFVLQAYVRSVLTGSEFVAALIPVTGVAFILFTFYMVTDPSTTPQSTAGQVAFGAAVAGAYAVLMAAHVVFGMFFALSIVCLARGVGVWAMARVRMKQAVPAPVLAPSAMVGVK